MNATTSSIEAAAIRDDERRRELVALREHAQAMGIAIDELKRLIDALNATNDHLRDALTEIANGPDHLARARALTALYPARRPA